MIVGQPGSGKSSLAHALGQASGLPVVHIDRIHWQAGWVERAEQLLGWIAEAGLVVAARLDIRPRHGKAQDRDDPLHAARSAEVTSLWRLAAA